MWSPFFWAYRKWRDPNRVGIVTGISGPRGCMQPREGYLRVPIYLLKLFYELVQGMRIKFQCFVVVVSVVLYSISAFYVILHGVRHTTGHKKYITHRVFYGMVDLLSLILLIYHSMEDALLGGKRIMFSPALGKTANLFGPFLGMRLG